MTTISFSLEPFAPADHDGAEHLLDLCFGLGRRTKASYRLREGEEAGVIATGRPQLFGLYCNEAQFRGDHVALYTLNEFSLEPFAGTAEILEARFFAPGELPDAASGGTRRRITEVMAGSAPAPHW